MVSGSTIEPATSVASPGTDHTITVPDGTVSSNVSTTSTPSCRPSSSVWAVLSEMPVDSGSWRSNGPSLTTIRNGSPSASSTPAAGAVRTTWPTTGTSSLRSRCTSISHSLGAIRLRASLPEQR